MIGELSQAVNKLQAQPLPQNLAIPERAKGILIDYPTPPLYLYTENSALELDYADLDGSLDLLAKTINSLEAEIEDKLFAIWQGVAIRQVEADFWGHPVPLDLIHEIGFSSMPMPEFLEFLGGLIDPALEFVQSHKHKNYTVGEILAWYITFRA